MGGGKEMKNWPKRTKEINKIIVHQSLSTGSAENIAKYHMSKDNHITPGEGLPSVAYHYLVDQKGNVVVGAKHNEITWHCKGANETSLGVCVLGDFAGVGHKGSSEGPSAEQLASLGLLLESLLPQYPKTRGSVMPHAAFGKPACPGFVLETFINKFNAAH